ncbi:MAG: hypothetical protein NVSMB29_04590 [Candidatus Dormibacteria bacterium]
MIAVVAAAPPRATLPAVGSVPNGPSQLLMTRLLLLPLLGLALARRGSTLLSPQLYAEDGSDAYAAGYNHGLASLTQPIAGYWQAPNRLLGLLAAQLPLGSAAALLASAGVACALLPVVILLWARRARALVPDAWLRVGIAVAYISIQPPELRFSATNAQWHLVIAGLMVLLLPKSSSRVCRAAELALLAVIATSGPLGVALLPAAAAQAWHRRDRHACALLGILLAGSLVEGAVFVAGSLGAGDPRQSGDLGASAALLPSLLASRVFLAFAGGPAPVPGGNAGAVIVCAGSILIVGAALWRGPALLRWSLVIGAVTLAAGLTHPYHRFPEVHTAWFGMRYQGAYQRYFFIPDLAFVGALVWLASRARRRLRGFACATVILSSLALASSGWSDRVPPPVNLAAEQVRLDTAPRGAVLVIPITPTGWEMRLTRH